MRTSHRAFVFALVTLATGVLTAPAWGDSFDRRSLTFSQLPMNLRQPPSTGLGAPFPGHTELSSAYLDGAGVWRGRFMADDFSSRSEFPIYHVHWWGSYRNNFLGTAADPGVKAFLISFEEDVPADANNPFSRPGTPILSQIVLNGPLVSGSGTFTETLRNSTVPEWLFEYSAELNLGKAFQKEPDTVYWLKIVALLDNPEVAWGWHNRDWALPVGTFPPAVEPGDRIVGQVPQLDSGALLPVWQFQDDAVAGDITVTATTIDQSGWTPRNFQWPLDGPTEIVNFSKDLAFQLYVPEPGTIGLLIGGTGIVIIGLRRARRVS